MGKSNLVIVSGSGNGSGDGDGYGNGSGNGDGSGYGYGDGYGDGDGDGDGSGNGSAEIDHDTPIIAYHYVPPDGKLRHPHGGQRPKIEPGLVLIQEGELSMCSTGLHASLKKEDAESYCKGILTKVACSGRVIFGEDKLVCSRREVLEVYED